MNHATKDKVKTDRQLGRAVYFIRFKLFICEYHYVRKRTSNAAIVSVFFLTARFLKAFLILESTCRVVERI